MGTRDTKAAARAVGFADRIFDQEEMRDANVVPEPEGSGATAAAVKYLGARFPTLSRPECSPRRS